MASVSLVSSPPAPVDKNMTDSELAGDQREDGELEDGEINDEGIEIEEENKEATEVVEDKEIEKGKAKEKEEKEKSHRHSRKRYKKSKEKRKSKRRRRDRQKHHSPSSSSSSDSYDSDYDRPEKPKNRKSQGSNWGADAPSSQHSKGGHGNSQRSPLHKSAEYDKYSDYSEDKYDYDEEEEDYDDDLSEYQHDSCQGKRHHLSRSLRGMKQQQQFGQRGRGRGTVPGRGRGLKKIKGKPWIGRGRGRGIDQEMEDMTPEGKHASGFQKKRLIMSKEFINQHTVEHNGRYICKYFLEGRCIKGEQCKFEHELVIPEKKKELCKFYLQGYCSKGEHCIYMHNEYPCKFYHTGAKCYQGDNCKFSHDALNDVTKELLSKIINTEEENAREDELELEDLRKQGIAPLPKPPPGVGLLPTPGQSSPSDVASGQAGKKIPSLFEIKVQPTVDLAQKIALSGSNFSQTQGDDTGNFSAGSEDAQSGSMVPLGDAPESPIPPQSSPGQHPPHVFSMPPQMPPGPPPPFHGMPPPFPPVPDLHMLQNHFPFPSVNQNPVDVLSSLLQNQAPGQQGVSFMQTPQQQMGAELQLQSLPPAIQKAIVLHLTQQQDLHSQGKVPQGGNCQDEKTTNSDDTTNWYSSDEEGGNSISSILKSLKKQAEIQQQSKQPPLAASGAPGQGDPRLGKDRMAPSDPRTKADPRQRLPDLKKESERAADSHLSRDPRKVRPVEPGSFHQQIHPNPQKPPAGEEDEDGERELRDRAVLIPLDSAPSVVLQDPRLQLKQFSHIRVDILLQRPAFAQTVVWSAEDLIPSLVPKQDPSINLPLPPLIADAQMNRSSLPDHSLVSSPPPSDPRLAAARLKERMIGLPSGTQESRSSTERPVDPRVKRTGSLDSKLGQKESASGGGLVDPRLQKVNTKESERLPPYAPRLASSGGGQGSPTTILGGISLYDPRTQAEHAQKEQADTPKKTGIIKPTAKRDNTPAPSPSPTQRLGFFEEIKSTDSDTEQTIINTPPTLLPDSPIKPPAVHNLPIQALAGLIRPQYTDPRQAKLGGQGSAGAQEEAEEKREGEQGAAVDTEEKPVEEEPQQEAPEDDQEDRTLKEVFKTFDPTASPFCQ